MPFLIADVGSRRQRIGLFVLWVTDEGPEPSRLLAWPPAPPQPRQPQGFCRQYGEVIKRMYFGAKLCMSRASLGYQLSDAG